MPWLGGSLVNLSETRLQNMSVFYSWHTGRFLSLISKAQWIMRQYQSIYWIYGSVLAFVSLLSGWLYWDIIKISHFVICNISYWFFPPDWNHFLHFLIWNLLEHQLGIWVYAIGDEYPVHLPLLSLSHVLHFWDCMDCSPSYSSVHRNSQARILDWVFFPSSGDPDAGVSYPLSWPRDQTCISCIVRQVLYHWTKREAHICY